MNVKLYKSKSWLEQKYTNEKLSSNQIGRECEVHAATIRNWLKKLNLEIRSREEAKHLRFLRQANHCNLSPEAIEWITGELLGDGCLYSYSSYSANFCYTSKFYAYIRYIYKTLKSFGIERSGRIMRYRNKQFGNSTYSYNSLLYEELLPLRNQWYSNGKKIVPRDIKLTPSMIRQWYVGDGSLILDSTRPAINLGTCGFPVLDVEWLVEQLIKLGFKTTRQSGNNTIRISVFSTQEFLDYIGPCPVSCYQYKWNYLEKKKEVS